ncbi:MAG: aminotransferase class I/II-fold pyridoxal phosphate-dependent enzyme [Faecalibacterium sp.]
MKYDFTSIMDRHGKDATAIDGLGSMPGFTPDLPKEGYDAIPMWVADMNFPTVPTIPKAIIERAKHPAYGYFQPTDEYFDSIIKWHETRNDVKGLTKECIGYENGVLGGVVSALTCYAAPGDAVLLHSPTYIGFTMCIENNGYRDRPQPAGQGRKRHLADGLRGHGCQDQGKPHPRCCVLQPPQSLRYVSGNAGRSRRPWKSTRPTIVS